MHIGLCCPELSGHLNPMTTLGGLTARQALRYTIDMLWLAAEVLGFRTNAPVMTDHG